MNISVRSAKPGAAIYKRTSPPVSSSAKRIVETLTGLLAYAKLLVKIDL